MRSVPSFPLHAPVTVLGLVAGLIIGAAPLALAAPLPLPAPPPSERAPLDLLFHADLQGRFAAPSCTQRRGPPDFSALVGQLDRIRTEAKTAGGLPPVALLGGNVAGPGLFARGLLKRDGDEGARALAALLVQAGYAAIALGPHDLGLERDRLERFVAAVQAAGVPLIATNLRCDAGSVGFCGTVQADALVQHGDQRVGVMAVISPLVLPGIPAERRQGWSLADPAEAVRSAARRLRERGASRLVLLTQMPRSRVAREQLEQLAARLGQEVQLDAILAGGLASDDERGGVSLIQSVGQPPIVGSPMGTDFVQRVRLSGSRSAGARADVWSVPTAGGARDPETAALLEPHLAQYCARYGTVLGPGAIDGRMDRAAFTRYALSVLRKSAGAEIAVINRGLVKAAPFPWDGPITRADLLRAMPYQAVVGVARLQGAQVTSLLAPALGNPQLDALGIERVPGGAVQVNGRAVDNARGYRVATIAFVAQGGDELFVPGALPFQPLSGSPDLRDLMEAFLATRTAEQDGDPDVDLAHDFGPPAAARPLWVAQTDLSLDLSSTSITGPRSQEGYGAPQLTRAEQRAVKGELVNLVQLRDVRHEADLRLRVAYGYARNAKRGEPSVSGETADRITGSGQYNFRGLRDLTLPVPRALVPDPYVRALLESELTRPATRTFHFAELTATVGALFTVTPKLRLRAGPGVRKQLFVDDQAPGNPGRTRPLIEAGATLDPVVLPLLVGGLAARLEGLLDYVFVDPTNERQHQLKASAKVAVPLVPLLFLTAGVESYATQLRGMGWATAWDALVGLRLHLDAARQSL